jgi:hypothetical protein
MFLKVGWLGLDLNTILLHLFLAANFGLNRYNFKKLMVLNIVLQSVALNDRTPGTVECLHPPTRTLSV